MPQPFQPPRTGGSGAFPVKTPDHQANAYKIDASFQPLPSSCHAEAGVDSIPLNEDMYQYGSNVLHVAQFIRCVPVLIQLNAEKHPKFRAPHGRFTGRRPSLCTTRLGECRGRICAALELHTRQKRGSSTLHGIRQAVRHMPPSHPGPNGVLTVVWAAARVPDARHWEPPGLLDSRAWAARGQGTGRLRCVMAFHHPAFSDDAPNAPCQCGTTAGAATDQLRQTRLGAGSALPELSVPRSPALFRKKMWQAFVGVRRQAQTGAARDSGIAAGSSPQSAAMLEKREPKTVKTAPDLSLMHPQHYWLPP